MKPEDSNYKAIVTRAFVETGKDGSPGLVKYIDKLEKLVLNQDRYTTALRETLRGVGFRLGKRRSRNDIHDILKEHKS